MWGLVACGRGKGVLVEEGAERGAENEKGKVKKFAHEEIHE